MSRRSSSHSSEKNIFLLQSTLMTIVCVVIAILNILSNWHTVSNVFEGGVENVLAVYIAISRDVMLIFAVYTALSLIMQIGRNGRVNELGSVITMTIVLPWLITLFIAAASFFAMAGLGILIGVAVMFVIASSLGS